ncbi:MAG: hypothetical protein CL609_02935 [Anaerolineaceae bacterium]|nr:hypothetical protein [Anaerolineaceae bacterium]
MIETKSDLSTRTKVYTITQAVLSGLGLLSALPTALFLLISGLMGFFGGLDLAAQNAPILIYFWITILLILVFAYSLLIAVFRFMHKPVPKFPKTWKTPFFIIAAILFFLSIILAIISSQVSWFGLVSSPFIFLLVLIPILLFVWIGSQKLSTGSPFRTWGNITFNFSITMPFIIFLELVFVVAILVFVGLWVSSNPELLNQLMILQEQLTEGLIDPVEIETMVFDFLQNPWVLNSALLVISLFIPLMEELFKPMALWFLAGKKLTPSQGFVGGLIAGACFALLETAGSIGVPTDLEWFTLLLGRTGTGLLHITLSGLVGWGLASLFYDKNWGRALGNYVLAVLIHGTWNLFALLSGIIPVLPDPESVGNFPFFLSQVGPFVLFALSVINLIILIRINQKLRRQTQTAL